MGSKSGTWPVWQIGDVGSASGKWTYFKIWEVDEAVLATVESASDKNITAKSVVFVRIICCMLNEISIIVIIDTQKIWNKISQSRYFILYSLFFIFLCHISCHIQVISSIKWFISYINSGFIDMFLIEWFVIKIIFIHIFNEKQHLTCFMHLIMHNFHDFERLLQRKAKVILLKSWKYLEIRAYVHRIP